MAFSKEEYIRYGRQFILPEVGMAGQEKLKAAKVLMVGAGGLGCPILQYLNAAGVGTLGIIDFDRIELHNLQRQILYNTTDVGQLKTEIAAKRLQEQNPHTLIEVFTAMLDENNAGSIIHGYDLIIDGSDNFLTRYLVNDTCVALNKPVVYGSILGFEGQMAVFNNKGGKDLRALYPEAPNPEDVPNCEENGVLGIVPGIVGLYMANAALQLILGTYPNQGKLSLFDLGTGAVNSVTIP